MDARRRLWAAAGLAFVGLILSFAYLQRRMSSMSGEILDEPLPPGAPTPQLPVENQSFRLQTLPPLEAQPQPKPYTNEDLQMFLEEDKKRLGIKRIYTKEELREQRKPPKLDPERARQAEEAKEKIRYMAEELRKANEARRRQPVAIDGDKPLLLSKPEDSYLAQGAPTGPLAPKEPPPIDSTEIGRPKRMGSDIRDESRIVRTQQELDQLWNDMKSSRPKPQVNFDQKMIVAVVADRDSGRGVLIPRIKRASGKVVVEYRDAYPGEDGTYYEIQIIDRTESPVVFQKLTSLTTTSP